MKIFKNQSNNFYFLDLPESLIEKYPTIFSHLYLELVFPTIDLGNGWIVRQLFVTANTKKKKNSSIQKAWQGGGGVRNAENIVTYYSLLKATHINQQFGVHKFTFLEISWNSHCTSFCHHGRSKVDNQPNVTGIFSWFSESHVKNFGHKSSW